MIIDPTSEPGMEARAVIFLNADGLWEAVVDADEDVLLYDLEGAQQTVMNYGHTNRQAQIISPATAATLHSIGQSE